MKKPKAKAKRKWMRWGLVMKATGDLVEIYESRSHARDAERCYRGFATDKPWAWVKRMEVKEC
jgi:hypothetical protein